MRLFDISNQYRDILENLYDPETGVVDEISLVSLQTLQVPLEEKCIAIATHIENIEAERKAVEEAKKKLAQRESRVKRQIDDMKQYLQENMENTGINKIKSPYFSITLCKNPLSVEITNEDEVPCYYDKIELKKDLIKIKEDLKNGVLVPGARLIQRSSIRIR